METTSKSNRPEEVKIKPGDKQRLAELISEMHYILDKYPYTNNYNSSFVTTMHRVKTGCRDLKHQVLLLESE